MIDNNLHKIGERITDLVMVYLRDSIATGTGRWDIYKDLRDAEICVYRFCRKGYHGEHDG